MERTKTIHPKEGLQLRKIKKQYLIVDACEGNLNMSTVYSLNATAACLWERVGSGDYTLEELSDWFGGLYSIDRATALKDVKRQLSEWEAYGLVSMD